MTNPGQEGVWWPASAGNDRRAVLQSAPDSRGVGAGSPGRPDTQVFLDHGGARCQELPTGVVGPSAWGGVPARTLAAPRALPAPPMTHVLCFHRAPPSYFSPATARPSQLRSCLPEVNFRRQVRSPGEGLLVAGPRAVLGSARRVWAAGAPGLRELLPLPSPTDAPARPLVSPAAHALPASAAARLISFRLRCVQSLN